jgi:F-type H+-transporting ATPase subunit epsilon
MKTFTLRLQDATRSRTFEGVTSFVGEDSSGSFGVLAGHARMLTVLVVGLARFRVNEDPWKYLAMPGAVLNFHDDVLTLSTRRFLIDDDYTRISEALKEQLLSEEEKLHSIRTSLRHMEEEILHRLWEMGRSRTG